MKYQTFKTKFLLSAVILPLMIFSMSGCIYMVVGGLGAVGGYMVSPDTVEGITENDELAVWDTAIDIVSIMGLIKSQSEETGVINAKINKAKVIITITPINEETTKLRVEARRNYFPKSALAQDVFTKIVSTLNE